MNNQFNLVQKKPHMAEMRRIRVLGRGSCCVVYLAAIVSPQEPRQKIMAVKSFKPQLAFALMKEARILQLFIGCEEIIQCMGTNITTTWNGQLIYDLLMEFAPYGSLGNLINRSSLSGNEIRVYTRMILKGLSKIHQKGIVHCDLKPDNILLFPNSSRQYGVRFGLKIADFGLSRTRGDEEFNDGMRFIGTPFYMSPESLIGQIGPALDIWSLGCIVIEMITRSTAWCKSNTTETLKVKIGYRMEAPKIPENLREDCKDFLSKCFVKDPSKRWDANMLLNHPFLYH